MPKYSQLYVHDPSNDEETARLRLAFMRLPASTSAVDSVVLNQILLNLQVHILIYSFFLIMARDFKSVYSSKCCEMSTHM